MNIPSVPGALRAQLFDTYSVRGSHAIQPVMNMQWRPRVGALDTARMTAVGPVSNFYTPTNVAITDTIPKLTNSFEEDEYEDPACDPQHGQVMVGMFRGSLMTSQDPLFKAVETDVGMTVATVEWMNKLLVTIWETRAKGKRADLRHHPRSGGFRNFASPDLVSVWERARYLNILGTFLSRTQSSFTKMGETYDGTIGNSAAMHYGPNWVKMPTLEDVKTILKTSGVSENAESRGVVYSIKSTEHIFVSLIQGIENKNPPQFLVWSERMFRSMTNHHFHPLLFPTWHLGAARFDWNAKRSSDGTTGRACDTLMHVYQVTTQHLGKIMAFPFPDSDSVVFRHLLYINLLAGHAPNKKEKLLIREIADLIEDATAAQTSINDGSTLIKDISAFTEEDKQHLCAAACLEHLASKITNAVLSVDMQKHIKATEAARFAPYEKLLLSATDDKQRMHWFSAFCGQQWLRLCVSPVTPYRVMLPSLLHLICCRDNTDVKMYEPHNIAEDLIVACNRNAFVEDASVDELETNSDLFARFIEGVRKKMPKSAAGTGGDSLDARGVGDEDMPDAGGVGGYAAAADAAAAAREALMRLHEGAESGGEEEDVVAAAGGRRRRRGRSHQ